MKKNSRRDPISIIVFRNILQGWRLGKTLTEIFAGAESLAGRQRRQRLRSFKMNIQTIQQMDLIPIGPQGPGQIEQPQRFGPEVKSGKIPESGIDQEEVRGRRKEIVQDVAAK